MSATILAAIFYRPCVRMSEDAGDAMLKDGVNVLPDLCEKQPRVNSRPAQADTQSKRQGWACSSPPSGWFTVILVPALYTLKEVFSGHYGVQVNHDGVLGILVVDLLVADLGGG